MKKIVALLLVAVMALGFVGCTNQAGGDVPTLVWYLPCDKQADTQLVCDEINKIIEPKIGAKIDIQYITSSDFSERLRLIMASQEVFDLTFTGFANPYLDGVRRGGFVELTDLLKKYGPELSDTIPDYLWEAARIDGGIYAIPVYQAMTMCRAIYFNKEYVDKYNFDTSKVKKLEDIRPFLEQIRDNEKGNIFPMARPSVTYFFPEAFRYLQTSINYISVDSHTNKVLFEYDAPEYVEARKILNDWNDAGFFNPNVGSSTPVTQVACRVTDGHRPGAVADEERKHGMEIIAVPISDYAMDRKGANTTMTAISATSKYPEKAMQFIVEVNTNKEVFDLCAYGIEGKHYERISDSHIKIDTESGYVPGGNWKYGCIFTGSLLEGYEDDLWEQIKKVNDESEKSVLLGFVADTEPVTTLISQIATVLGEYGELNNGTSQDFDKKLAEFEQKLEKAGKKELVEYAEKLIYKYFDEKGIEYKR